MKKITKVFWGKRFLRTYKKLCKNDINFRSDFKSFFKEFCTKPDGQKYNLHRLKGRLKDFYSVKIKYDLRLIVYIEKNELTVIDIGTHDEVY